MYYYDTFYKPSYRIDCDKKYIAESDSTYYQLYLKVRNRNSRSIYYDKFVDVDERSKDSVMDELDELGKKLIKKL